MYKLIGGLALVFCYSVYNKDLYKDF